LLQQIAAANQHRAESDELIAGRQLSAPPGDLLFQLSDHAFEPNLLSRASRDAVAFSPNIGKCFS
jgi:hypothetical protein